MPTNEELEHFFYNERQMAKHRTKSPNCSTCYKVLTWLIERETRQNYDEYYQDLMIMIQN